MDFMIWLRRLVEFHCGAKDCHLCPANNTADTAVFLLRRIGESMTSYNKLGQPYICPMGVHQEIDEPCPRCGATEDSEGGCLGFKEKLEREIAPTSTTAADKGIGK